MTVTGKPLPPERTVLEALDRQARATVARARAEVAPIVARETPRRSGKTAAELAPRVSRTQTGAALSVGVARGKRHDPHATIAQVMRWVQRGTGLYRTTGTAASPPRRIRSSRIPPRRLVLPGGRKVWSVKGQRPNPFMARIQQTASPRVFRACEEGAVQAAQAVERVIG